MYYVQITIPMTTCNLPTCFVCLFVCFTRKYLSDVYKQITKLLLTCKLQPVVGMQISDLLFACKLLPVVYVQIISLLFTNTLLSCCWHANYRPASLHANCCLLFTSKFQPAAHTNDVSAVYMNFCSELHTTCC